MISFIVPAFNEAFEISRTLQSIAHAATTAGAAFEVLVVNDASTDDTPALARAAGARVVDVNLRQISRVRNAGAREAQGDVLIFVDADTRITPAVITATLKAISQGAVGGGAWVEFEDRVGWWVRLSLSIFSVVYGVLLGWAAGCFFFARKDAFLAVGGFDETLYASEEIFLSITLKRRGRFVILSEKVQTSSRKLRMNSPWAILPFAWRFARQGMSMLRQRDGLEWWYDGKRE